MKGKSCIQVWLYIHTVWHIHTRWRGSRSAQDKSQRLNSFASAPQSRTQNARLHQCNAPFFSPDGSKQLSLWHRSKHIWHLIHRQLWFAMEEVMSNCPAVLLPAGYHGNSVPIDIVTREASQQPEELFAANKKCISSTPEYEAVTTAFAKTVRQWNAIWFLNSFVIEKWSSKGGRTIFLKRCGYIEAHSTMIRHDTGLVLPRSLVLAEVRVDKSYV